MIRDSLHTLVHKNPLWGPSRLQAEGGKKGARRRTFQNSPLRGSRFLSERLETPRLRLSLAGKVGLDNVS